MALRTPTIHNTYNNHYISFPLDHNPILHTVKKGEDQTSTYVPPLKDVQRVLLAANLEEQDLLTCILKVGARLSEVLRLDWDDVNMDLAIVKLWTWKRKGGGWEYRPLKMPRQMQQVISRRYQSRDKRISYVFHQPNGEPWIKDGKWVREMMDRLCERADVKPFTFHALRHRIAASLEDSGEAMIGMIQGHGDVGSKLKR